MLRSERSLGFHFISRGARGWAVLAPAFVSQMPFVSNPGLPAIALIEAFAIFMLMVLYWLLARSFAGRFLRYWMAGWALYAGFGAGRALFGWRAGPGEWLAVHELSLAAGAFFLAAILDYAEKNSRIFAVWPLSILGGSALALLTFWLRQPVAARWLSAEAEAALYLSAGWVLWRSVGRQRELGTSLLAASLLLRGLHLVDRPDWPNQALFVVRISFEGFLEVAMGTAMAVLVLEAARARTEDLNERSRRLTLITAAATQSLRVEEVLGQVLHHLTETMDASHGLVRLFDNQSGQPALAIHAAVGFSPGFLRQCGHIPASTSWAGPVLEKGEPFIASAAARQDQLPERMDAEKVAVLVVVRIPGKEGPQGLLEIGSTEPRNFQNDEVSFLSNVANLLGLTIQNVRLLEGLANAQREWANTFDSIRDLILVHDPECRILRVNRGLAERLGCDAASVIGRPVRDVLRRGDIAWCRCPYCEEAPKQAETPDPTFGRYFLVTNSDFHDHLGERLGTIHVLKDFTERKEAETKFRTLFENMQEGVFISTPEGRFLDFNDAFLRLLGGDSREELLNGNFARAMHADPGERDRLAQILAEHGQATDFEFRLRRRDGEIRTVTESSFAARDAAGKVTAYQGFVLDVTERKQAELELRRRNRDLLALNSIAQTLAQSLELETVLDQVLRQVVEQFGVDLGAIYLLEEGGAFKRVAAVGFRSEYALNFPPTVLPAALLEDIHGARATLLSMLSLSLPETLRDVHAKEDIQVCHLAVLWAKDRITGGLTIACRTPREFSVAELNLLAAIANQIAAAIDKSLLLEETRRAYENLRRTQEQLLQSEKMAAVGQLISGVTHELNNPLTAILGYSQLLDSQEHVSPRGSEYVAKLYKQAQRTHRIVQNLLSFARQKKPERTPVRLNQILEDTLVLREYDLKLNNVVVHREFDPNLGVTAGDAHQLQQVFLNILNNAFDAVAEKTGCSEIWVRTAVIERQAIVEFTDSGPGVQDPLRVFDPFYTTKPVGKGTGLGLSICYGIIKEHGGEISVRNSPPRGATFTISLPMLPITSQASPEGALTEGLQTCGRVLLVDDEEAVLDLEREILRDRCLAVSGVSSGREALEMLARGDSFDVVVADLKMPGEVSGYDLYRWIERNRPELAARVVFTMSNDQGEGVRGLLEKTGCPSVQKPFPVEEFLGAVRKVLAPASPVA
jgi:PAS domain S-box-containing protein